ncbi:MAG: D-aminoacyl-tRNA deacylase [Candidatus Hodarchaeales archaeon]|jgi:D-aminoacyl-tRNA deacylase
MNIIEFLNSSLKDEKLLVLENDSIYSDEELSRYDKTNTAGIFLSRHRAKSLRPSFTVHPIGNYGQALFGGEAGTLAPCEAFTLKQLLLNINNLTKTGKYSFSHEYEISIEATHHGPASSIPIAFIEVGSSEAQWRERDACQLIADAVSLFLTDNETKNHAWESGIAFGSNHYSSKFTRLVLETDIGIGHVCAKYAIPFLNASLVNQMVEKTFPRPVKAFFDKKSLKRKQEIRGWLIDHDVEVIQI